MKVWIDAQLSPALAPWLTQSFEDIEAISVRDLGLRDATDVEIFTAARQQRAVVITKDSDFLDLLSRLGPPPQIVGLTCGNTSNARLRQIMISTFPVAIRLLTAGEPFVEIRNVGL